MLFHSRSSLRCPSGACAISLSLVAGSSAAKATITSHLHVCRERTWLTPDPHCSVVLLQSVCPRPHTWFCTVSIAVLPCDRFFTLPGMELSLLPSGEFPKGESGSGEMGQSSSSSKSWEGAKGDMGDPSWEESGEVGPGSPTGQMFLGLHRCFYGHCTRRQCQRVFHTSNTQATSQQGLIKRVLRAGSKLGVIFKAGRKDRRRNELETKHERETNDDNAVRTGSIIRPMLVQPICWDWLRGDSTGIG